MKNNFWEGQFSSLFSRTNIRDINKSNIKKVVGAEIYERIMFHLPTKTVYIQLNNIGNILGSEGLYYDFVTGQAQYVIDTYIANSEKTLNDSNIGDILAKAYTLIEEDSKKICYSIDVVLGGFKVD